MCINTPAKLIIYRDIPTIDMIKYQKDDNLINTLNFIIDMYKNNNKIDVEVDFNPIRV